MGISDHKSYNLGENKIERKTPVHFEIKNEDDQGPKCTFFFIVNLGELEGLKGDSKILFYPWLQTWTE